MGAHVTKIMQLRLQALTLFRRLCELRSELLTLYAQPFMIVSWAVKLLILCGEQLISLFELRVLRQVLGHRPRDYPHACV